MKAIKLITTLAIPALALSSASFSLVSCGNGEDKPTPGPTPDPSPEPEPEIQFQVQFINSDGHASISTSNAIVGKQFSAYILLDTKYKVNDLKVQNSHKTLSLGTDYKFEPSVNRLTIYANNIDSETLIITVSTIYISEHMAVLAADSSPNVLLGNQTISVGADFVSTILTVDSTKIIETVDVTINNVDIPSTYDSETQILTVSSAFISSDYDIVIKVITKNKPYEQYIYERTFSIAGRSFTKFNVTTPGGSRMTYNQSLSVCFGTAWIIDDATPETSGDYVYYLATNFHVVRGNDLLPEDNWTAIQEYYADQGYHDFQFISASDPYYYFADKSIVDPSTGICPIGQYSTMLNVERQNDTNFYFNDEVIKDEYYPCVDFHVYKADLSNANDSVKIKLDTLNLQKQYLGYINTFVPGDDDTIINKNKYIGGYPYRSNGASGGKWTYHDFSSENIGIEWKFKKGEHRHEIDSDDPSYKRYDVCPGIYYTDTGNPQWMGGGASGSMILTSDYEISAIYWGHWGSGYVYGPCTTLFISNDSQDGYNFVEKFLTEK